MAMVQAAGGLASVSWVRTGPWGGACASNRSLPTSRTPLWLQVHHPTLFFMHCLLTSNSPPWLQMHTRQSSSRIALHPVPSQLPTWLSVIVLFLVLFFWYGMLLYGKYSPVLWYVVPETPVVSASWKCRDLQMHWPGQVTPTLLPASSYSRHQLGGFCSTHRAV